MRNNQPATRIEVTFPRDVHLITITDLQGLILIGHTPRLTRGIDEGMVGQSAISEPVGRQIQALRDSVGHTVGASPDAGRLSFQINSLTTLASHFDASMSQ